MKYKYQSVHSVLCEGSQNN